MPLIDGVEVFVDEKAARSIQTDINAISDLGQELKTDIDPKKIDLTDDSYSDGSDFNIFFDDTEFGQGSDLTNRKTGYDTYKEMDGMEFIHRGIEIISDDSSQPNDSGDVMKFFSDDEAIKDVLDEVFIKKLDMNNELWTIFYETVKMGDNFYEIVPDDYKKPKEIRRVRYLEPDKVERIEKDGKLSHFTYKVVKKKEGTGASRTAQEVSEYRLFPWQIIHFKIDNKSHAPYGGSLLEAGIRTYRRLVMLEDLMLVYRISRAPERRVFYIDVGNLNAVEAKRFLTKMKNAYRSQSFIDENGNINKKANVMSITSDIFVPVREGQTGTRIETLQGGAAMGNSGSEDPLLKYFKDKILKTMNIPPSYMGEQANLERSLCLHPETKIKLTDGRDLSIKDISEEFKDGKKNFVYSIKDGEWVIKPIKWAGMTRQDAELVEVVLDNDKTIKATPDHKFMLRDGSYCEAQDLKENTSLMPIYSKLSSSKSMPNYEMLMNNNTGEYEYTHRIIKKNELREEYKKNISSKERKTTTHHIDFLKNNNNPSNLICMTNKDHWNLHSYMMKEKWKSEEYRKKMCKRGYTTEKQILKVIGEIKNDSLLNVSKYMNINRMTLRYIIQDFGYKDWESFILENLNEYNALKTKTKKLKIDSIKEQLSVSKNSIEVSKFFKISNVTLLNYIKKEGYESWANFINKEYYFPEIMKIRNESRVFISKSLKISTTTITNILKALGYKKGLNELRVCYPYNHKVKQVRFLEETVDTYDITVDDETPNFALSAGVVVHNSTIDQKFGRFIERVQSQIIQGLNKVAALELFFKGYKKEDLSNFKIELTPPSNVKEITEIELINQRMALIAAIQQLNLFPNEWILKNILKMSNKEIADITLQKKLEGNEAQAGGMAAGVPGDIAGMEIPAGAVPPEGEAPPEAPVDLEASTITNMFGKDFLIENKTDFFNLIKASKDYNKTADLAPMFEAASSFITGSVKVKSNKLNRNNIVALTSLNEFKGIDFERRVVTLWEKDESGTLKSLNELTVDCGNTILNG